MRRATQGPRMDDQGDQSRVSDDKVKSGGYSVERTVFCHSETMVSRSSMVMPASCEHALSAPSPPSHELNKMVLAKRGCSTGRICGKRTTFDQTPFVAHGIPFKPGSYRVCRTDSPGCKAALAESRSRH